MRLFSPQQWSKQGPLNKYGESARAIYTRGNTTTIIFPGSRKTIQHDAINNLPLLQSSPGYEKFAQFAITQQLSTYEARLRPTATTLLESIDTGNLFQDTISPTQHQTLDFGPDIDVAKEINPEAKKLNQISGETPQDRLLRWHYRLGHLPFKVLQNLAKHHIIDPALSKVEPPFCPGCMYGKQTRRTWRTKPSKKLRRKGLKRAHRPGQTVSVDTMPSGSVPGLMPQLKGTPTTRRYRYATVFIDHYSDLTYTHMHENNSAEQVLEGKLAFERFAYSSGVRIRHYHSDNGVFADKDFIASCKATNQTYSFCGVNAHHQNGVAERRIRDLRESARSMSFQPNTIGLQPSPRTSGHLL